MPQSHQEPDAQVQVRNLVKHFFQSGGFLRRNPRAVRAVDGVSFDIRRRETLGLVGESGCGKTTIGRCLLRLIEPTSGEVYFEGTNVLGLSGRRLRRLRRDMQIVFQNPYSSLDPRMSVLGIVGEPLQTHTSLSHGQIRERVVELLEQVGMSGAHIYRYPHEFSGGQLQRIAVARALALEPKFLVLDEPTAALDVSVQAQVIAQLMELQRNLQLTYLFISHNLTLVHYVSQTIAVTYLGRIVERGEADQIFDNPLHPYTQALLSATPSLDRELRKQRLMLGGGVPDPANPPPGCVFHPRCPRATDPCKHEKPELVDVGGGHLVACHL
ncbi:MAG: ATP-binding cassette domain-containing protein [Anaerolineae bacterium]|nr:ATP-binding cassette domain-containing protein [Anaerolineae bacterium]